MWTKAHRARQAAFERRRYPTDLTDAEWEQIKSLLPKPAKQGRKPGVDLREVLNAIRYLARSGCGWRMLPHDFPSWQTVYWWFRRFASGLLFRTIQDIALMLEREQAGREASPSAGVLDSQTREWRQQPRAGAATTAAKRLRRQGRKPGVDLREVLNAIRYLARSGCGWRMLPHDFPSWQTVYWWFRRFARGLLFRTIHDIALMLDREQAGREASPSAGVLDSQTVKAPAASGGGGYDAAKRLKGRKRHIAVDTDGRLLMVNLTTADVQDAAGAEAIIVAVRKRSGLPGSTMIPAARSTLFADGAYDRGKLMSKAAYRDFVVEVVRKLAGQQGFQPLPRRWVVERTFGWMMRWRRLVRDHEQRCDVSEAMIHVSMGSLLLRRTAHP